MVQANQRYPKYICRNCVERVTDNEGRRVTFVNIDFSGGCRGYYADTKASYDTNVCYVDGHECIANEARFGGIVIEKN